jgi:UPF0755 protein
MRKLLFLLLVLFLSFAGFFAYAYEAAHDDRSLPAATASVIVPKGSTASEIGRQLVQAGIIRSPLLFTVLARLEHDADRMHAGQFRFMPHQSMDEILRLIATGGDQVAVWVTFPEGFTAREMARTLAVEHHLGSEPAFVRSLLPHEGFLFPSTYLIPIDTTPEAVAGQLVDQFREELPLHAAERAKRLGLSIPQVVTLASLIEREAKADDERRLMAGVYYNRLRLGMPLEVDATIEYIFPQHKEVITLADLARDSPYNTYKHVGLPPTPIANPGRASLLAAFDPQPSGYLFYVYKGNGHHAFSRTLAEQRANIARYLH